jgi:hypothetical protein
MDLVGRKELIASKRIAWGTCTTVSVTERGDTVNVAAARDIIVACGVVARFGFCHVVTETWRGGLV